jgi:hypothetical protein
MLRLTARHELTLYVMANRIFRQLSFSIDENLFNIFRILLFHMVFFISSGDISQLEAFKMIDLLIHPFIFLYQLWQALIDKLLSPVPPLVNSELGRPKIAIIGAGLTGVSAAAHCVGHGFDVQIFEAGPKEHLGGIWSVRILRP